MAYTQNVPLANQLVSQSQSIIQANFVALTSFGNGWAELSNQSVTPTFSAGNDGFYTKTYATTTTNEMFIHIQRPAAATVEVPFTASRMSNTAAAGCINGWAYLPNGLLVKWGTRLAPSAIIFATDVATISGGPNYTTIFQTFLTPYWQGPVVANPSVPFLAASGTTVGGNFNAFVSNFDGTRSYFNYMVIGV